MLLIVAKQGKIYYIREINGVGITIKKNNENKYMICLDDRVEPIATYTKWENANMAMDEISKAYANSEKLVVISPND
jgi:hypothetical protein